MLWPSCAIIKSAITKTTNRIVKAALQNSKNGKLYNCRCSVRARRSEHRHGPKTGLSDLPPVEVPRTIHRREHPDLRRKNPTYPVKQTTQNCSRTRLRTPSN